MRWNQLFILSIAAISLVSCGKPSAEKSGSADPCDSTKAQPPYLTQEQAIKACKDNRNFAGKPTQRSKLQITNQ